MGRLSLRIKIGRISVGSAVVMRARTPLTASIAAGVVLILLAQSATATTWLPTRSLGGSFAGPGAMAMAGSNTVGVAYTQISNFVGRVYFRRSTDGGATWRTAMPISPSNVVAHDAALSSWGSTFDLVWLQEDPDGDLRVRYARSTDGGVNWGAFKTISQAGVSAHPPRVARDGAGRVAIVWTGSELGVGSKVYARVSNNAGTTFGTRRTLDGSATSGSLPNVAIGKYGRIHSAFYDNGDQLVYRRSRDGGGTWSSPQILRTGLEGFVAPAMAAAGKQLLIGYTATNAQSDRFVVYRRSIDNGAHFQAQVNLSGPAAKDTWGLILSVRSGTWRAEFARCGDTDPCSGNAIDLAISRSVSGGTNWSSPEVVPTAGYDNPVPAGISGGNKTVVAWTRDNGAQFVGVYARRAQ